MTVQEEAIRELKDYLKYDGFIGIDTVQMAIEALRFQQELVRCGDCRHYICDNLDSPDDAHIMICDLCSVGRYRILAESDGYCSEGERRYKE